MSISHGLQLLLYKFCNAGRKSLVNYMDMDMSSHLHEMKLVSVTYDPSHYLGLRFPEPRQKV